MRRSFAVTKMTDPAIGSSSPDWACLISAGRIPNSNVEPEETIIPTDNLPSEQTLASEQALEHDTIGEANLGAQMSPYAPVFYPTGSYAAQLLAQEQAAQLHSRILPPRHFEPGMDSIFYSTAVAAGYSPRPNREQQHQHQQHRPIPEPDNDPEPNQNSFGLGMGPSTSGIGRAATGTTLIDQDNRLDYRPLSRMGLRPIRSPGQELRCAVEAAAGLPPGAIGAEVEAMERAMERERQDSPASAWAPYSYANPVVIVGDNLNDQQSPESPDATSGNSTDTATEQVASGATDDLPGHSNMYGNANANDFPPFDLFAGQLDHVGVPRDDYIATLRNLLIRANDMLAPLLQGPFTNMSPTQIAAYTAAILDTPPLHPSLFMPGNMARSWAGASGIDLPPFHPHSLTPQDLATILALPKGVDVGTQTDFRCVCMNLPAGQGPGAAGLGLGGNPLQAGQPTAGPHVPGVHYSYDMNLNASRLGTPVGTPGSPMATPAAFATGSPIPQANNGPTTHGSLGFWGRPLPMAMHPHQVGTPTPPPFHTTHPHAAFPHPGPHAQMAYPQVATHPHQLGGAVRYQETGAGRYGYRVGHFSPAPPCRYGAIGNGRTTSRPASNLTTSTISVLRSIGAGAQVADQQPSPLIQQMTQQRLDEIEQELEMQLRLDLQQNSDAGSSTDASNSGTGTGRTASPAVKEPVSRNKKPQDLANNDLSARSVVGEEGNSTEDGGEGDIEDGEGTETESSSSSASEQSIVRHGYRSEAANDDQDQDQDQESEETSDSSFEEEEEEAESQSESEDGVDEDESVSESESESESAYDEEDEDESTSGEEEDTTEPNTENAESEGFDTERRPNPATSGSSVQGSPSVVMPQSPQRRFCFGQVQFLGYTLQENTIQTGPSPRLPHAFGAAYLEHGGPQTPREHLPCAQVMPHILPASFVTMPTMVEEIGHLGGPVTVPSVARGVARGATPPTGGSDSQTTTSSSTSSSSRSASSQSLLNGPSTSQHIHTPGPDFNPPPLPDPASNFLRAAAAAATPPPPPPQMFSLLQERPIAPILFDVGGSRSPAVGPPHVVIQNVNGNLGLLNAAPVNGHGAGLGSPNRHLGMAFNAGAPLSPQSLLPPHMRAAPVNHHVNINTLNINVNHYVGPVSHMNHHGLGMGMGMGMAVGMGVGVGVGVGVGMGGTHMVPVPLSVIAANRLQQAGVPPNLIPQPPSPPRCYTSALNRSHSPNSGQNLAHNHNQNLSQVLTQNLNQALNHNINHVLNHNVNQALHSTLNPILVPRLNINHTVPGVLEVPTLNGNGPQLVEVPLEEAQSNEAGGELGDAPRPTSGPTPEPTTGPTPESTPESTPGATPEPTPEAAIPSSPASLATQAAQVVAATFGASIPRTDAETKTTPSYASMLQ
ncbi:uncharacterized protein [Drosophila bipectinata]|uniref:uncharacterized protein isoform X1 n=2 Tax=Drosophila bipectinata TaxID=42026 RepID=UPI0038B39868